MKAKNSEYFATVKQNIVEAGFMSAEISDFYQDIFGLQDKYLDRYKNNVQGFVISSPDSLLPVLKDTSPFSAELNAILFESFNDFVKSIEAHQKGLNYNALLETYGNNFTLFNDTLKIVLSDNRAELKKISDDFRIGFEEYYYLVLNMFKPLVVAMRGDVNISPEDSSFEDSRCPFCGYYPDMSKIVESRDNVRILHCGFCENEWRLKRLLCSVCGNTETEKLGYLTAGDDTLYRVDYCEECMGYIKTLKVNRQNEETKYNLTVENIITTRLDASAMELGYKRP